MQILKIKIKERLFYIFLEGKDFSAYHFTRKFIVDSELPFDVDMEKRRFTLINNLKLKNNMKCLTIEEAMKQVEQCSQPFFAINKKINYKKANGLIHQHFFIYYSLQIHIVLLYYYRSLYNLLEL